MNATITQHGFWYYNWGNVASLVGVVLSIFGIGFTIWTLITAKSAERAAIEAKDNSAIVSFSNDARKAERHNKDIILHMQSSHFGDAVFRSADLLEVLSELYERCPRKFDDVLKSVLLAARTECEQNDKLIRKINGDPETPTTREIERVIQKANSIHQMVVKARIATVLE